MVFISSSVSSPSYLELSVPAGHTSIVEYRALEKLLKEKSDQRDETLLQVKVIGHRGYLTLSV